MHQLLKLDIDVCLYIACVYRICITYNASLLDQVSLINPSSQDVVSCYSFYNSADTNFVERFVNVRTFFTVQESKRKVCSKSSADVFHLESLQDCSHKFGEISLIQFTESDKCQ